MNNYIKGVSFNRFTIFGLFLFCICIGTKIAYSAPGIDSNQFGSWEPTIAIDPNNPQTIAIAQGSVVRVSFDAGTTFTTLANPGLTALNPGGDPSLTFDSQGRLYHASLCRPGGAGTPREICVSGYTCALGACNLTTNPMQATVQAGLGGQNADKEWIVADASPASPFTDRIHMVWTDLSTNPWMIYVSYWDPSPAGQTWSPAIALSLAGELRVWPSHISVSPEGFVYVAYHSQTGFLDAPGRRVPDGLSGQIVFHRSEDGGDNWQPRSFPYPANQADMTWNVQHLANGVIPNAAFWLQGSSQPWVLADPSIAGRVYVVANDDPDNMIDSNEYADVFIVSSDDFGDTWTAPMQVDNGPPGTLQVMPTAAIDPVTGAIVVTYYDNRNDPGGGATNFDLLARLSTDGGNSWQPEVDFNDGFFNTANSPNVRFCLDNMGMVLNNPNPATCTSLPTTRIGEYNGVAFGECSTYAVWADDTGIQDIDSYFDFDPELSGDLTAPEVTCPADMELGCTAPTDPDSLGFPTITDACDLDPTINSFDVNIPVECPALESFERTFSVTDAAGNNNTCSHTVTVVDNDPPQLQVPDPLVLECNTEGGVSGNDPLITEWLDQAIAIDQCTATSVSNDAPELFEFGCGPGNSTNVNFTGADICGNSTVQSSTVTVTDNTPPELDCDVNVEQLWPPNHKFIDVGLSIDSADLCDPDAPTIAITVTSDESTGEPGDGSGGINHCVDAIIGNDGSVQLRAERSGKGDGRVYTIQVSATDACGNQSICNRQVAVPKSAKSTPVDSGQLFSATQCNS